MICGSVAISRRGRLGLYVSFDGDGNYDRSGGIGLDRYGFIVFEEGFDVTGDGVLSHRDCLVARVALGVAAGEGRDVRDEAAGFVVGFEDDRICVGARDQS